MKRLLLFITLFLLAFSVACTNNNGYWENNYDNEYDSYTNDNDLYAEDGDYIEGDIYDEEEYSFWDDWLYDSPEDCYEDEYFDEEEQLCFLIEDAYDDFDEPTLVEDLLTFVFTTIPQAGFEPSGDGESAETVYNVNGDQIVSDTDSQTEHQELWAYFARLIPADARGMVTQFGIASDGPDGTMAWVEPLSEDDLSQWMLVVDPADAAKPEELTFTLIHEYGHLLTLNQTQLDVNAASCSTYYPQEGCSYENAYVNSFYEKFWVNMLPELQEIETEQDEDRYYDQLDAFYQKYEDQFVSDYAATNLEEDMAESWAFFVLNQKPDGNSIAEQKILFFYDYPELVELRTSIIQRTNARLRRSTP